MERQVVAALLVVAILLIGCGEQTARDELPPIVVGPGAVVVPPNTSEAELVFYTDPALPMLMDMWLPPNDAGVTHLETLGDPATGRVEKLVLYRGDERAVVIQAGADGLVGTSVEMAGGWLARIASVDGNALVWVVVDPSGQQRRVRTIHEDMPRLAHTETRPSVQFAALRQADPLPRHRPATVAAALTRIPLDLSLPDGEPPGYEPGFWETQRRLRCAPDPGVECTINFRDDPEQGLSDLYVVSSIKTDLANLPAGPEGSVYETIEDCEAGMRQLNYGALEFASVVSLIGIGAGEAVSAVAAASATTPPTLAVAGVFFVAGLVISVAAIESGVSCVELTSNEAIRQAAFGRFDGAWVAVDFDWLLAPEAREEGWTLSVVPRQHRFQPFLTAHRGGAVLDPVRIVVSGPSSPAAPLAGSRFEGDFSNILLGAQFEMRSLRPEVQGTIVVSVVSDREVDLVLENSFDSAALTHCAGAVVEGVPLRPDGSFEAHDIQFKGAVTPRGSACEHYEMLQSVVTISGRLDMAAGRGRVEIIDTFADRWERANPQDGAPAGRYDIALSR